MDKMICKFLLVSLFVEILSCAGTVEKPEVPEHDHFKLSLMWPNSFCWTKDVQCRASVPQYFVVKSLWAEGDSGNPQPITNCGTNLDLTDNMISRHKYDLLKYWPDLGTYNFENSKKLWKDQWKTFGSCCADQMYPESYITSTLKFRQNNNMFQILKSAGILANGSSYPADKIITAIKKATRVTVDIVCEADTEGTVFLSEIHQCVDNEGKKFVDCEHVAEKCDKDPIFPDSFYG